MSECLSDRICCDKEKVNTKIDISAIFFSAYCKKFVLGGGISGKYYENKNSVRKGKLAK